MSQAFPYTAWLLLPSFKPCQVTIAKPCSGYGSMWAHLHEDEKGKTYNTNYLFSTKEECITDGWKRLSDQEAALETKFAKLRKRKETLGRAFRGEI